MKKIEGLTNKQEEILDSLKKFKETYNYTPTIREFGNYVGLNSPATVKFHLDELQRKGYIKRKNNRSIEVLNENNK